MYNDLGSGSNVDICVITKEGSQMLRNYEYLQVGGRSGPLPCGVARVGCRVWFQEVVYALYPYAVCRIPCSLEHPCTTPVCHRCTVSMYRFLY